MAQVFYGPFIHSVTPQEVDIVENALVAVSSDGTIVLFQRDVSEDQIAGFLTPLGLQGVEVQKIPRGQFFVPGFVDTHNHAPQWTQRGLGRGPHIMEWLMKTTFPHEARFKDPDYARRTYADCVEGFIKQGVTCAAYYGSLHGEATKILAEICLEKGQRALVGKCNMVRNAADFYRDEGNEESLQVTEDCIAHIKKIDPSGRFVAHCLTPRFAICCDAELLAGIGKIAEREKDMMIQTHFDETPQEVAVTKQLFPHFTNEADLYDAFGLFNNRCIFAHCIYTNDYEIQRMKEADVGVSHCPISNTTGGEWGAAPVRTYLDLGMKVGLGTDSGGGFSSSILDCIRQAFITSGGRAVMQQDTSWRLTIKEAFYLATMGGARVCNMDHKIGSFAVGKEFDALRVNMTGRDKSSTFVEPEDTTAILFEKFLMSGDDRNIEKVYVLGRSVKN